jgi:transposase InsO family protein
MAPLAEPSIESGQVEPPVFRAPATLVVALFIVLRDLCPQWKHWPSVDTLLKLTGAGRSQAYEYARVIQETLPTLLKRPGRPPASAPPDDARLAVLAALNHYLCVHPGAVSGHGPRTVYSDGFRHFIGNLVHPGQAGTALSTADLATLTGVPLGTLKNWLFPPRPDEASDNPLPEPDDKPSGEVSAMDGLRDTHRRLMVTLWQAWEGPFQAFCAMLRTEYRLPYGDTHIGTFLQAMQLRQPRRHMPVEAPWSSGTYRCFFPGGQWLGDGSEIKVRWGHNTFIFNLESIHDVASDATVGFAVTDVENEEAVRLAYEAALETTAGQPPEVLTLDNKPCNHSLGAVAATPGTTLLRSTPGRGQSKAPIEGSFGLFQQTMPPLVISATTPREQARQVATLVFTAWYRGRNGKPRERLKGKTPAEAYAKTEVTPQERAAIREWIKRQLSSHETREARRDPARIELLTQGLAQAGMADPEGRHAKMLAYYSREAIVRGLATFLAKQELGTVPSGADPVRYLGGIIRQLDIRLELERISMHLLAQRLRLRDLTLAPLQRAAEQVRQNHEPSQQVQVFAEHALRATLMVDAQFWMAEAAAALRTLTATDKAALYERLCRRVAATFSADRLRRQDLIDRLAAAVTATDKYVPDALQSWPTMIQPREQPVLRRPVAAGF